MNYEAAIQQIIDVALADKSLHAKWKRKGISRLEDAVAAFGMAMSMTHVADLKSPAVSRTSANTFLGPNNDPAGATHVTDPQNAALDMSTRDADAQNGSCTCPLGGVRRDCPVHGVNA